MIGKREVDSSTKLLVAVLVLRVYAHLLLPPFFHTMLSRTQVVEPPISTFVLPSIELCDGVAMERCAVLFNVPTQLALISLVLCCRGMEVVRVMA